MIIWGSGSRSLDVKSVGLRHCATCGLAREHKITLNYNFAHLYFLRWVTSKTYYLACDICRRGVKIDGREVEKNLKGNPIPFMTRYGWAFLVGIPLVLLSMSSVGSRTAPMTNYQGAAYFSKGPLATSISSSSSFIISVPKPGSNAVLSISEIRYCDLEKLRIDAIHPLVKSFRTEEISEFNKIIANYNNLCSGTRAQRNDVEKSKQEIEARRNEFGNDAKDAWLQSFPPVKPSGL